MDFDRIRKHNGFVYFWSLNDYLKPNTEGSFSGVVYKEVDCKVFRFRYLSDKYFKGQMGRGEYNGGSDKADKDWRYPSPNSVSETVLKSVCSR